MDLWPESPTVVGPCSPYAPVLDNVYTSMAWMIPSLVAPTRTETSISWRGVEAVWLSVREKIILDGRPVFQVTKAGKISETTVCFAPKPPPILGFTTRIFDLGIPRALEMIRRTWNTIWVELKMFSRP